MIDLSIIVASHDREHCLRSCLRCIQRAVDWHPCFVQVLVADDCPDNRIGGVVAEFPRFIHLRHKPNISLFRNLQVALRQADGKHVLVLGDDDLLYQNALPLILKALPSRIVYLNYDFWTPPTEFLCDTPELVAKQTRMSITEDECSTKALARIRELSVDFVTPIYSFVCEREDWIKAADIAGEKYFWTDYHSTIPHSIYIVRDLADVEAKIIAKPVLLASHKISWGEHMAKLPAIKARIEQEFDER